MAAGERYRLFLAGASEVAGIKVIRNNVQRNTRPMIFGIKKIFEESGFKGQQAQRHSRKLCLRTDLAYRPDDHVIELRVSLRRHFVLPLDFIEHAPAR